MDQPRDGSDGDLTWDDRLLLDRLCEEFSAQWAKGREPRIENFVVMVDGPGPRLRPAALRRLLPIDLEARERLGEHPVAEQYEAHFPGYEALIRELVRPRLLNDRYEVVGFL